MRYAGSRQKLRAIRSLWGGMLLLAAAAALLAPSGGSAQITDPAEEQRSAGDLWFRCSGEYADDLERELVGDASVHVSVSLAAL